jgi:hypothetical protein
VAVLRGDCGGTGERTLLLRLLEVFERRFVTAPPLTGFFSPAPDCDGDGCGVLLLGLVWALLPNGQMLMVKGWRLGAGMIGAGESYGWRAEADDVGWRDNIHAIACCLEKEI